MNTIVRAATFCVALIALTPFAQAENARTWISGKGVDKAGCGAVANPCRTLQYAYLNTAENGEINVLDAAGYGGNLEISKSISIVNDGAGVAGVLAPVGGAGFYISAGSDAKVTLRGLTIEGAGAGFNGIVFNSAATLLVSNCFVQGFLGHGIFARHGSGSPNITILNTLVANNANAGVRVAPIGTGGGTFVISELTATGNQAGISFDTGSTTVAASITAVVTKSSAFQNTEAGFQFSGSTNTSQSLIASLTNSTSAANQTGILVQNRTRIDMSHVVSTRNSDKDLTYVAGSGFADVSSDKTNLIRSRSISGLELTIAPY